MEAALGRADAFDLFRMPDLEPRRGPNVPSWLGSGALGLIFMPLAGGPTARVAAWLETAGGVPPAAGFTRRSLRQWMREVPGHRSYTVVTHPLRRAHDVFREKLLVSSPDAFVEIRAVLRDRYGLDLPGEGELPDRDRHRTAFLGFLRFLKANLAGQTSVRVPAAWASQAVLVRALSDVLAPDAILRAETVERDLPLLRPGLPAGPAGDPAVPELEAIYDPEVEEAARAACARDYAAFGYGPWR
jgi:hypothetical protein